MATPTGPRNPAAPQRRWQAPCPGCGAVVEFQSPTAAVAVCSYCRSTVVREGDALKKIGVSAELLQDHTPLQIGAAGTYNGRAFTLIGRLQYGYRADGAGTDDAKALAGSWNEWHALFDDGKSGWLSEDNDQYVFAFDVETPAYVPAAGGLKPGHTLRLGGIQWSVASTVSATLLAAAGELPSPPALGRTYPIADLRSATNRVATLDYANPQQPAFSVGQPVRLADLALAGTRDAEASAAVVGGRSFVCPHCGASITVKLADTQSITCGSCRSLIDVSRGVAGELKAVQQSRTRVPRIPLGATGTLTIGELRDKSWQVVGFAVKEGGIDDPDPDEHFTWDEYLLYNREEGFAFLIDSEDGWVCYRTLTGAPLAGVMGAVAWAGGHFRPSESYASRVKYVEGEYYWKVDKGQRLQVQDYLGLAGKVRERLSRETSAEEVVWSWGVVMSASVIAAAFKIALPARLALGDVRPTSSGELSGAQALMFVIFIGFMIAAQSCSCDDDDYDDKGNYIGSNASCTSGSYRGGSFHK